MSTPTLSSASCLMLYLSRGGTVTEDGRYLIIDVSRGCDPFNMLYYYDLSAMEESIGKIKPSPLFDKLDAKYEVGSVK